MDHPQAERNGGRSACHLRPKPVLPDGGEPVTQAVAGRSDLLSGWPRRQSLGQIAQLGRRFADPFQAPLNRIVGSLAP